MAKRRCLLVLSVLSGETPVSEAIEAAAISRNFYYDLESRALAGMLSALMPSSEGAPAESPAARIEALENQVKKLEQEKRRNERLLMLTRQLLKPGTVKSAAGRPRKTKAARSTSRGTKPSTSSATTNPSPNPATSIPTKDGEVAR